MNNKFIIVIAIIGVITGFVANQYSSRNSGENITADTATTKVAVKKVKSSRRPNYSLKDLEDKTRSASEWDGKVVILNFWATWCPPCRREMPAFIQFQETYQDKGVTFVGIALDEKDAVVDFTDPMGMNYPILIAELEGIQLSQDYGNRLNILPFTVIIDRKGNIVKRFSREVSFENIEEIVKPLL